MNVISTCVWIERVVNIVGKGGVNVIFLFVFVVVFFSVALVSIWPETCDVRSWDRMFVLSS